MVAVETRPNPRLAYRSRAPSIDDAAAASRRRRRSRPRVHADAADLRRRSARRSSSRRPTRDARRRRTSPPTFDARAHASVESLCADPASTSSTSPRPHELHAAHVAAAAAGGKHVLVEKPMAVTLDECQAMIDAVARAGVPLIVGHSHSFDRPDLRAPASSSRAARSARVRMIHAQYYTDFLYRPRRPEELDTARAAASMLQPGRAPGRHRAPARAAARRPTCAR